MDFSGGERGIRTLGGGNPSPVFKTGALNHSTISPGIKVFYLKITKKSSDFLFEIGYDNSNESRGNMKTLIKSVCCVLVLAWAVVAQSGDNADFNAWKQSFRKQAAEAGVSTATLNKYIPQMKLLPSVVSADRKQPEFISTFWDYTDKRLSEPRISRGQMMMKRYPSWLKRMEDAYGVPAQYIVAFWGLETNYGNTLGNTNTLDALATLAYDKRRRTFFTKELIAFLKILETERFGSVQGSWAGAFGQFQFMPTTFLAYAVDGDGHGTRNVIANMPDAFASAANYLHKMGWTYEEPWGHEVVLPEAVDWRMIQDKAGYPVQEWINHGYRLANGTPFPMEERDITANVILPMGATGPAFLVYPNFKRIMKWNKSELYALTVAFLADILKGEWQGIYAPRQDDKISHDDVSVIQTELSRLGYYSGTIDGQLGPKTRQAILMYQREKGLPEDGYPSQWVKGLLKQ